MSIFPGKACQDSFFQLRGIDDECNIIIAPFPVLSHDYLVDVSIIGFIGDVSGSIEGPLVGNNIARHSLSFALLLLKGFLVQYLLLVRWQTEKCD